MPAAEGIGLVKGISCHSYQNIISAEVMSLAEGHHPDSAPTGCAWMERKENSSVDFHFCTGYRGSLGHDL